VDFSHATKNRSRKEKAREIKDLAYILGMDLPTEPAAHCDRKDVVEKPVVLTTQAKSANQGIVAEVESRALKRVSQT
jgi:hypothetical protein